MTDRASELEAAASAISLESLEAAKHVIAAGCEDYLRWSGIFLKQLENVSPADLHKFARALALTELGHLPTRPTTCPFCIQYGKDRNCEGCGYARTHGRCDSETSAFSQFIEAFLELGRTIYQDTSEISFDPAGARKLLHESINESAKAARQMLDELPDATALRLMELKVRYLKRMIGIIPIILLSGEVEEWRIVVIVTLENYW